MKHLYFKPEKVETNPKNGKFIVYIAAGLFFEFTSRRAAEAFGREAAKALQDSVFALNELYLQAHNLWRKNWPYFGTGYNSKPTYKIEREIAAAIDRAKSGLDQVFEFDWKPLEYGWTHAMKAAGAIIQALENLVTFFEKQRDRGQIIQADSILRHTRTEYARLMCYKAAQAAIDTRSEKERLQAFEIPELSALKIA